MDDEALIQYKNVEIHQQELCVLSDVNLELHKGEFVYLILSLIHISEPTRRS